MSYEFEVEFPDWVSPALEYQEEADWESPEPANAAGSNEEIDLATRGTSEGQRGIMKAARTSGTSKNVPVGFEEAVNLVQYDEDGGDGV